MIQLRPIFSDYWPSRTLTKSAGLLAVDDHAARRSRRCLWRTRQRTVWRHAPHSYFPVRDDEILVEEAHTDPSSSSCVRVGSMPRPSGTSVCFQALAIRSGLSSGIYVRRALAGVRPLGGQDRDVLTHLREILHGIERSGDSGFACLHDPLGLAGAFCSKRATRSRVLTCRTTTENDPGLPKRFALFQWEAGWAHGNLTTGQGCMQFCKSVQKCAISRNGHTIQPQPRVQPRRQAVTIVPSPGCLRQ